MKTIYWAVKLDQKSRTQLLSYFPPKHPNVYAEHMTIAFAPSKSIDDDLMNKRGTPVTLKVIGYKEDNNGQAVEIESNEVERIGGGTPHITISCSLGTKPIYSNNLLKNGSDKVKSIILLGTIARFTNKGWDFGKEI